MKLGDTFPLDKYTFVGNKARTDDRYFIVKHWLGLSFLPMRKFITLEHKGDCWEVIKIENK